MDPIPTLAPYAYINDDSDDEAAEECVPAVLQVNQLLRRYEEGLELVAVDKQAAADVMSEILEHPLAVKSKSLFPKVSEPIAYRAKHLYRSALKVLGEMLADDPDTTMQALEFWREAVMLEPSDVALWYKLGKLALEADQNPLAWYSFERGLSLNPKHVPMLEKFMECCLGMHDLSTCRSVASHLVQVCPRHKRAKELMDSLQLQSPERSDFKNRGVKRPAEDVLQPRVKRRPLSKLEHSEKDCFLGSVPLKNFGWERLAETVANLLKAAPFEQGDLLSEMTKDDDDEEEDCAAMLDVFSPNDIRVRILQSPSSASDEGRIVEVLNMLSDEEEEDELVEVPKPDEELTQGQETLSNRQNPRPKRQLQKGRPPGAPVLLKSKCQNVMQQFYSVFGSDTWASMANAMKSQRPDEEKGQHEDDRRESSPLHMPADLDRDNTEDEIKQFLKRFDGGSIMEIARALVEHRLTQWRRLEDGEAQHHLAMDGVMKHWFEPSPRCALKLAELHMDAIVEAMSRSEKGMGQMLPMEVRIHVDCCDRALSCLHRLSVGSALGITSNEDMLETLEDALRFRWTQARLFWFQRKANDAKQDLNLCLSLCEMGGSEIRLKDCKQEMVITPDAIRKKLSQLVVIEKLDRVEGLLARGMHEEVMEALLPLLERGENDEGSADSMLSGDQLLRGLQALKEAAVHLKNHQVVFLAYLRLFEMILPSTELPDGESGMAEHMAHINGTPRALAENIGCQVTFAPRFQEVENFVCYFEEHMDLLGFGKSFQKLKLPPNIQLMHIVLVKAIQHLEWCYWRITVLIRNQTMERRRQRALHDAAVFVLCLHRMHPHFSSDLESMHQMCSALLSLLEDRNAVAFTFNDDLTFNKILHFCLSVVSSSIQSSNDQHEFESLNRCSISANCTEGLSYCLESLYGVKVCAKKHTQWGQRLVVDKEKRAVLDKEQALKVWSYVEPYFQKLEDHDSEQFEHCEELLTKLADLIPQPPEELLSRIGINRLLQDDDQMESSLQAGVLPSWLASDSKERLNDLEALQHKNIYERLYYWTGLSGLRSALDTTSNGGILGPRGTELVERQVRFLKLDITFNPERAWTWETLAIFYKEAVNSMLDCAARELHANEFVSSEEHMERIDLFLRYQKKCYLVLRLLCQKFAFQDEQASAEEMIAEILYCRLQRSPPFHYDTHLEGTLDEEEKETCLAGISWWETSRRIFDQEWSFPLYLGRMIWKLKNPGYEEKVMDLFAEAAHLASLHEGGLVDPIYKLHSTRLKLLMRGCRDWKLLTKYVFDPANQQQDFSDSTETEKKCQVIFDDCREALEFCRGKVGTYHKVHYHLALAYFKKGNYEGAGSHIRQLFVQGKKPFCISMTRIDPEVFSGSRKRGSQNKSRRASPVEDSSRSVPVEGSPVGHWGFRPPGVAGPGLEEPIRKFAGAIRKYLMLYFKVLFHLGDYETLEAAAKVLRSGKLEGASELRSETDGSYHVLQDMGVKALGVFLVCVHQHLSKKFSPDLARAVDRERSEELQGSQNSSKISVPEECFPVLQLLFNTFYEHAVEGKSEGFWLSCITVALQDVLGETNKAGISVSGQPPIPSADLVAQDLASYARAFVVLLEQTGNIMCLEQLACMIRKRFLKRLMPISPVRILANRVCRGAMDVVRRNLGPILTVNSSTAALSTPSKKLVHEGLLRLVNVGKGLEQHLSAVMRDELEALCQRLYGLHGGDLHDITSVGGKLSHLLRRCEELIKIVPAQDQPSPPQSEQACAPPPPHAAVSTQLSKKSNVLLHAVPPIVRTAGVAFFSPEEAGLRVSGVASLIPEQKGLLVQGVAKLVSVPSVEVKPTQPRKESLERDKSDVVDLTIDNDSPAATSAPPAGNEAMVNEEEEEDASGSFAAAFSQHFSTF
ncbi:hypothetical protein BSKO_00689 [Bryopsis sp. KO-2023]|nr:hypothetical protein BSKO_00689 [Bryopsis sp. KO-2023]